MNNQKNKILKMSKILNQFLLSGLSVLLLTVLITNCSDQDSGGQFAMPPMPVEVAEVKMQVVSEKFEAVGTIEAIEEITVVSEINAAVVALPFIEGSQINKGELIAQLDDSQIALIKVPEKDNSQCRQCLLKLQKLKCRLLVKNLKQLELLKQLRK